jgi:antitoxin component of MazEF toxin-antitoxin module
LNDLEVGETVAIRLRLIASTARSREERPRPLPRAGTASYIRNNAMRKHLSAIGNSLGLVIEKPILELLAITKDTELEVVTDGERIIIEPVRSKAAREEHQRRVATSTKKVLTRHRELFAKLAK